MDNMLLVLAMHFSTQPSMWEKLSERKKCHLLRLIRAECCHINLIKLFGLFRALLKWVVYKNKKKLPEHQ